MPAVLVDVDNTLVRGPNGITKTITFVNELARKYHIIILTGRPDSMRAQTISDLQKHGVKYHRVIMNSGSMANSVAYKLSTAKMLKEPLHILYSMDDNPDVRSGMSKLGIKPINASMRGLGIV